MFVYSGLLLHVRVIVYVFEINKLLGMNLVGVCLFENKSLSWA